MEAVVKYLEGYNYSLDQCNANIISSEKTLLDDFLGGDRIRHDPLKEFEVGASNVEANDLLGSTDSSSGREDLAILDSNKAPMSSALSMKKSQAGGFDEVIEYPPRQDAIAIGKDDSLSTQVSATRILPNDMQSETRNRSPPSAFLPSYPTTGITRESVRTIFGELSPLNFGPSFEASCSESPGVSYDPHSHPMFDEASRGHQRNQSGSQFSHLDSLPNAYHSPLPGEYLHGVENSHSPQRQNLHYKYHSSDHPVYEYRQHEMLKLDLQSSRDNHLSVNSQKHGTSSQNSSLYNNPPNYFYQHTASRLGDQLLGDHMQQESMYGHGTKGLRFGSLHEARMDVINTAGFYDSFVDKTIPRTDEEDCRCVAKLMVSMYEMSQAQDNETMLKTWRGSMNDRARVEGAAWEILAYCKSRHQRNGPFPLSKKPQSEYSTFGQRLSAICQAMLHQKTICQCLVKQSFREEVIENPISAVSRIRNNRKVNRVKKHAIEVGREALGVRTAGKGYKVTSVSTSDSDNEIDKRYNMEGHSLLNPYSPATFPAPGLQLHMPDFDGGDSAHYYQEGSLPKKAKRFKHQSDEKKGTAKGSNNNNRSHTKTKAGTNLGGVRAREHNLAFVENIAAAAKADSKFQATSSNAIWPHGSNINQAQSSNKRRRGTDDTDYNPDGEYHQWGRGSKKSKIRKSA